MWRHYIGEVWDEVSDFAEDYWELLSRSRPKQTGQVRQTVVDGVVVGVRPAYLFAERIDNTLKLVFGASICLSALTATFLGFTKLSDLLSVLITTGSGRFIMFAIGGSQFVIATWKLMRMGEKA